LKHQRKDYWIVIKSWLMAFWALTMLVSPSLAQSSVPRASEPLNKVTITNESNGPVVEFRDGDYVLQNGLTPPTSGWKREPTPKIYRVIEEKWRIGDLHTLWAKHRFDRASLSSGPFALYTVSTRTQFTIYLNGVEVYRNFANDTDLKIAWYRPYLIQLPNLALRPGINEVIVRASSIESVGVGRIVIGPRATLEDFYNRQFFWRITAPMVGSASMLILGIFALLIWVRRREEVELVYLTASTIMYFLRNSQYFLDNIPFHLVIYSGLAVAATLLSMVLTFAFYISFLKVPNAQRIIAILIAAVIPYTFVHWYFQLSNMMIYLPTIMLVIASIYLGTRDLIKKANAAKIAWLIVMVIMLVFGVYDASLAGSGYVWKGNDFYLAVFNGFFFLLAFLLTFGLRALSAFSELSNANVTLERRVIETRAELAISESARQKLLVDTAVASERDRLMQEMHDGIGSNLITALAVARRQDQPKETIDTLKRAISDLKITVDSLEPIEGDIVVLLGNLRHRMARDLRDAGLTCKWYAEPCAKLDWLDATNSLHVLRIFQEAIGNILAHAEASEISIGCKEALRDGVKGIAAFVADNGQGFDANLLNIPGKGLSNMRARAASLHGYLDCDTCRGKGTTLTLWLPNERTGTF
jgi:signal transduction histidine kinase